jgi:2-polyprenyl-6-hydroxyphenyl methylase/3-demethylubiquinone-9 3-methyltransferase
MLKPNGQLVITIDAHNHSFFKNLFRAIPGDVLHPHQYDLNEYNQFLTSRNLKIVKTEKLKSEFFFNHYLQVAVNTK